MANKKDITDVYPTFQALTKSTGKALDQVHSLEVLHRRDKNIFSVLPASWAIIYSLKANVNNKLFSFNKFNILKKSRSCLESFSTC